MYRRAAGRNGHRLRMRDRRPVRALGYRIYTVSGQLAGVGTRFRLIR